MNERELFYDLMNITDTTLRLNHLAEACKGDEGLRKGVEALLLSHVSAGDFLEQPIACPPDVLNDTSELGDDSDTDESRTSNHFEYQRERLALHLDPSRRHDSLGRLGHYEVLEVLGKGGNGTVFKAFDEKLHRFVAIKMMSDSIETESPERQRFLREARAAAAVRHQNVVAIHAVEESPVPYLVMEYVPAKTLQEFVDENGPLDVADAIYVASQIAHGLKAAHSMGLIHRDIKPSNILLESGVPLKVKIVDFGLARDANDASVTQSGVIAGTPMYMSPEQARGETLDHRTDLFSLGSVVYFLLSGRSPFHAGTTLAAMQRVTSDVPRAINEVGKEIPSWFGKVVAKLLAKAPEDRFQTASDVECALDSRGVNISTNLIKGKHSWAWIRGKLAIGAVSLLGLAAVCGVAYQYQIAPRLTGEAGELKTKANQDIAIPPFEDSRAARSQTECADKLGISKEFTNSIGMKFRLIPPGEFTMGSSSEEIEELVALARKNKLPQWAIDNLKIEGPEHSVQVSKPFYVSIFETTVKDFREMVKDEQYVAESIRSGEGGTYGGNKKSVDLNWETPFPNIIAKDNEPVSQVSWNDAEHFCRWLSTRESKRYRLLTEAEWEYACRAGTTTRFFTGVTITSDQARIGSSSPCEVGAFPSNQWGLHDLLGNVAEWCFDQIDDNYARTPGVDPQQSNLNVDQERVLRGGAFFEVMPRAAQRRGQKKSYCADTIGFRVAVEIDDAPSPRDAP